MTVTYPNGDQVGYTTVAYDCKLLTAARPDLEEVTELGWFSRGVISSLPREPWIDRVIQDAAHPAPDGTRTGADAP